MPTVNSLVLDTIALAGTGGGSSTRDANPAGIEGYLYNGQILNLTNAFDEEWSGNVGETDTIAHNHLKLAQIIANLRDQYPHVRQGRQDAAAVTGSSNVFERQPNQGLGGTARTVGTTSFDWQNYNYSVRYAGKLTFGDFGDGSVLPAADYECFWLEIKKNIEQNQGIGSSSTTRDIITIKRLLVPFLGVDPLNFVTFFCWQAVA